MKNIIKTIIGIFFIIISVQSIQAQSLADIISNPDLNYFQIQEQIHDNKSEVLSNAEDRIQIYAETIINHKTQNNMT